MFPFTVKVAYRLREYLSIVWDYFQYAGGANPRGGLIHPLPKQDQPVGALAKTGIALIAIPAFFYKARRVGQCEFTFADSGLTRRSKGDHVTQVPWSEVRYVYSLSQAFLIADAEGAMPVPYRCLSGQQHEQLDRFFTQLNAARR